MGTAVNRLREFPFREHRTLGDVQEQEWLEMRYRKGTIMPFERKRLQTLQARTVLPPEPEPPQRA